MNMNAIGKQFQDLNGRDPWLWPVFPRVLVFVAIAIAVAVLSWFLYLTQMRDELDSVRQQETGLRTDFSRNYQKAVNLDALKKQREQALQYVNLLEKQLPSKAEMPALLSDINQAGVGRGLQFELFKPGSIQVKDYYAELPIEIVVSGSYDEVGEFVSDIAHLPRIVTLGNLDIARPTKADSGDRLTMKAIAKTYRYLDEDEVNAQAANNAKARK